MHDFVPGLFFCYSVCAASALQAQVGRVQSADTSDERLIGLEQWLCSTKLMFDRSV